MCDRSKAYGCRDSDQIQLILVSQPHKESLGAIRGFFFFGFPNIGHNALGSSGVAMLRQLAIKNLTVFPETDLQFAKHLNVIVGENGAGKTHLLKMAYAVLATSWEEGRKPAATVPTKVQLQTRLADKLVNVFRPEALGRLARRRQGRERCDIKLSFDDKNLDIAFSFATNSKSEVALEKTPKSWLSVAPAYIPTRELLTIFPNFVSVYESHYLEFEETWRDTCVLLGKV